MCDNITGVCSCTISKKDVFSTPPAAKESITTDTNCPTTNYTIQGTSNTADVVKTIGETSSLAESTLVARPENNCASSMCTDSPSLSKSKARKETEITLKSFSEADVDNCTSQEGVSDNDSLSKATGSNNDKEKGSFEVGQGTDQGTQLSSTQEAVNGAEKEGDGSLFKSAPDPSPPKQAWATPTLG